MKRIFGLQPEAMDVMQEGVEELNAEGDEDSRPPSKREIAVEAFEADQVRYIDR